VAKEGSGNQWQRVDMPALPLPSINVLVEASFFVRCITGGGRWTPVVERQIPH